MRDYKVRLGEMRVTADIEQAVLANLRAGRTTEGQEIEFFEKNLAEYIGVKYAIAVSSGTAALYLIFDVLKDSCNHYRQRVITSPLTYTATVNAPMLLNYDIELADIDADTFGLDIEKVNERMDVIKSDPHYEQWERLETIVMPVHLLGYPVPVDKLEHSVMIVEDSCEAVGSTFKGKMLGSLGYASAVSFYPSHTLQVGEMGAILTNDEQFANQCKLGKDNGRNRKDFSNAFVHKRIGLNFKSNDLMATIGNAQLRQADKIVARRQEIASMYWDGLPGSLEKGKFTRECAYLGYPIVMESKKDKLRVMEYLERAEIEVRSMFTLIPDQPAFRGGWGQSFPVAERISNCGLYLPCHQYLADSDVEYVIKIIREFKS